MKLTPDLVRAALEGGAEPLPHGPIDISRARPAAVTVPLFFSPEPKVLLVLRSPRLADHAGEVGFPGGKPEPDDANLRATAGRELEEEVGIEATTLTWLGELHPCPVITGRYMIHPFVAAVAEGAQPRVASSEIARVIELPLGPLLSGEQVIYATEGEWKGTLWQTPHIQLDGCILYGASAFILYELIVKLALRLDLPPPGLSMVDELPWGDRYAYLQRV